MHRNQVLPAVVGVAIGAGLVALLTRWSLAGLLPLVIVLLCPLIMLVMMGGMHHRDDSTGHRPGGGAMIGPPTSRCGTATRSTDRGWRRHRSHRIQLGACRRDSPAYTLGG
jgi:hypothetical protein